MSKDTSFCVDRSRGDLPLLAWRDVETAGRAALHEPLLCKLHLYHTHEGIIAGKALTVLHQVWNERLRRVRLRV